MPLAARPGRRGQSSAQGHIFDTPLDRLEWYSLLSAEQAQSAAGWPAFQVATSNNSSKQACSDGFYTAKLFIYRQASIIVYIQRVYFHLKCSFLCQRSGEPSSRGKRTTICWDGTSGSGVGGQNTEGYCTVWTYFTYDITYVLNGVVSITGGNWVSTKKQRWVNLQDETEYSRSSEGRHHASQDMERSSDLSHGPFDHCCGRTICY